MEHSCGMRSRERIIRATRELIETGGFSAVTISAVAAAAGVSRQTVYSHFGSGEELVGQTLLAVALDELGPVEAHLAANSDSAYRYIVEMMVAARAVFRRQRVLQEMLRAERGNPLFDEGMIDRSRQIVSTQLSALRVRDPVLEDPEAFDSVVEMAVRLSISIVVFDSEAVASDDDLRRFLSRWLAPVLLP
jgi:AcrR family transcriptional regulator